MTDGARVFRAARAAALLLLSVCTAGVATLAWGVDGVLALAGRGVLMALALGVSGRVAAAVASTSPAWRERARLVAVFGSLVLFALGLTLALGGGPARVPRVAAAFAALQPLLLLLADSGRSQAAPLANAMLLVVVATLAGAPWAGAAVIAFLALAPYVLAFDHAARQLAPWPRAASAALPVVAAEVTRLVVPVVIVATLAILLLPVEPGHAALAVAVRAPADPAELQAAYRRLALLGVLGLVLAIPFVRLLRAGGAGPALAPESADGAVTGDELLAAEEAPAAAPDGTTRGRVVAAYLRVLRAAVSSGFRRRAAHTPLAIARELHGAEGLDELTSGFMDARYGEIAPSEEAARALEDRAARLAAGFAARRRTGARPPSARGT